MDLEGWASGAWADGTWADGTWGITATVVPDSPHYMPLVLPAETPGPAPRLGDARLESDADFYALARLQEMDIFLQDVADWMQAVGVAEGEEVADVDDLMFGDAELFGRKI